MTLQRKELRDDLTAIIAAGRELSPQDDALLADVFLDRMVRMMEKPHRRRQWGPSRAIRRCAGVAGLALACGMGSTFLLSHEASRQGGSEVMQPAPFMKMGPVIKLRSIPHPGKYPPVPVMPAPPKVP